MSEPASTESPPPGPSYPEAVFRAITPIFRFRIEGADAFTHAGTRGPAHFRITLRPFTPGPDDFADITRYATEGVRQLLRERSLHNSDHFFADAMHFLVIDLEYAAGSVDNRTGPTGAGAEVLLATLEALRLHSLSGITFHETYQFRTNGSEHAGLGIYAANALQNRFSHLPDPSVLGAADFDSCRATIDGFLVRQWSNVLTLDNVLQLAKEYQRTSCNLEHVAHAFLILMVAFEALFKKEKESNASRGAQRIGRLLGQTKAECTAIAREFFHNVPEAFCNIRNRIAHGDAGLDVQLVRLRYVSLHAYIAKAIVRLLALPMGTLDGTKDYYDEVSRFVEARFAGLPTQ